MVKNGKKMLSVAIISTFFAGTVVFGQTPFHYSTDELEEFLMNAIRNNETIDFDFDNYDGQPCAPYVPNKPDYAALGYRKSDTKCLEYVWEMENRENETEWGEICRLFIVSQVRKGIIPEFLFIINSPVIFGGRAAIAKEFPHMGAIGWRAKADKDKWVFKCGGTLISKNFVLTAAHCSKLSLMRHPDIARRDAEIVRLGAENIADDEFNIHGELIDAKIKKFIVHPEYAAPRKYNDIALIELEKEVTFMSNIQPACLWPRYNYSRLGKEGSLTGWGYTEKGAPAEQLQTAVVDFIETSQCQHILSVFRNRNWGGFRKSQICAGKLVGGVDTCQGDSGGPLQVQIPLKTKGKMYWVVGVTSFGVKCGQRNRPGIYSRVASFIDWIENIVWPESH